MSSLQNHEVDFIQEGLPITNHNFYLESVIRPKSKSPNWQGSQGQSFTKRQYIPRRSKTQHNLPKFLGKTNVRPIFISWNTQNDKKVFKQLTCMSFLQNHEVCSNQESLSVTYCNFHCKSLVKPKK